MWYQPSLRGGKKWSGWRSKNPPFFCLGDDTIPGDGQAKSFLYPPRDHFVTDAEKMCLRHTPDHLFLVGVPGDPPNHLLSRTASPPDLPSLISMNMSLVGHATWKRILFSDLKTLEVYYTIFGSESPGSVYYFRSGNCGSVYYFRI